MVEILVACTPGEARVAAVADGELLDYAIWRPGSPDGVGDLHRGRVSARMPALGGAFVALAGMDGFLPDSAGAAGRCEGERLGVRITRAAQGGKGPRLAVAELRELDGDPALLVRGPNPVERFSAMHPGAMVSIDDPGVAALLRARLQQPPRLSDRAFPDWLDDEAAQLGGPEVEGPGGTRLRIHPTPALVAIDMDLGRAAGGRDGKVGAHFAANRDLLPLLARHIRLRNLSGAIVVDFAGLPVRKRQALRPALEAALAADPLQPRLLGFTALGLAEIVRPRIHPPLHELLTGPHAAGLQALAEIAARAAAEPGRAFGLRAGPGVAAALRADPVALPALVAHTGRSLMLRSDPGLGKDAWEAYTDFLDKHADHDVK